jgi:hypothetical protein
MVFKPMSKPKTPDKPRDLIPPGEQFIRTTYLRLHRQKQDLTTEQAAAKLEAELKAGTVVRSGEWNGVQEYLKL